MLKIESEHRQRIEDFRISYDAGLNKDMINEWRSKWVPLKYILEIKMDVIVIGIVMDINRVARRNLFVQKQVIEALKHF